MHFRNNFHIHWLILLVSTCLLLIYFFPKISTQLQHSLFILVCMALVGLSIYHARNSLSLLTSVIKLTRKSNKANILVVDDNIANLKIAKDMVDKLSYTALEASRGEQAISMHKKHRFKLILMDIEMDGINGIETMKRIRKHEGNMMRTPIIAISAHNSPEKKQEAFTAGFDDYLTKPIDEGKFKSSLERWMHLDNKLKKHKKNREPKAQALSDTNKPILLQGTQPPDTTQATETVKKVVDIKMSLTFSRNNADLAKDMLTLLIKLVTEEKDNMLAFFKDEQWSQLNHLVHKLNGGSCYCGVPELQKYAELIDKALNDNDLDTVSKCFPQLKKAMDDLLLWSEEYDIETIFSP